MENTDSHIIEVQQDVEPFKHSRVLWVNPQNLYMPLQVIVAYARRQPYKHVDIMHVCRYP